MKHINIAIDGPAGAGKSTISKIVAGELGFVYIDTGAMYRAAALYAIEHGIDIKHEKDKLIENLDSIEIDIKHTENGQKIYLCGKEVTERIREADVSIGASDIAVIPEVRLKLVELQRTLARGNHVIMDGRDIGTYVLPDADLKIFLTASLEDRAMRRYEELKQKGIDCEFESVKKDMAYRDKNDSEREFAPLKMAEDATLADTTGNTLEQSVEMIKEMIKTKMEQLGV
ncbi:MAG: (d)CMP kinase [Clostridia bacterium]|nr:(d)CMP kinase [Clostridia bacterium]